MQQILREIDIKLEGLEEDKSTFEKIESIELKKKAFQKAIYMLNINENNNKINVLRHEKTGLMRERDALVQQRE